MKIFLLTALAAYIVAAIHSVLGFINQKRALERVAHLSLGFGFAAHTIALIMDWASGGYYPLFHFSETFSFLGWALVIAYAIFFRHYRAHALGGFTLPLVALLVLAANISQKEGDLSPHALMRGEATWLFPIHTTSLFFAYAAFVVVFIASIMYLLQERELKLKHFGIAFHRLPALATIDEISAVAASIGFAFLTLGIIAGMSWSFARDGRVWRNDPKEILAAMTWLLYLALLSQRHLAGWGGRRAAWVGVAGFALVLCTFFGARLMGGYHVF
jgi:ABC-type transport system involved in cytochrome c biogenesis permease subunit